MILECLKVIGGRVNSILLVILYNKNFYESSTLESLLSSSYSGDLLIFNNGPLELDLNDSFFSIEE
jgi:hypothetical protein